MSPTAKSAYLSKVTVNEVPTVSVTLCISTSAGTYLYTDQFIPSFPLAVHTNSPPFKFPIVSVSMSA